MLGMIFSVMFLVVCVYSKMLVFWWIGVLVVYSMMAMNWGLGELNLGVGLGGDLMSSVLVMLSLWLTLLMVMASESGEFKGSGGGEFLALMLLLCLMLILSFGMLDLMGFYLFFESALVPIFLMIVGWGHQPERLMAGVYMLFYTLLASLPLLIGVMSLYWDSGSLGYMYLVLIGYELGGWWWMFMVVAFFVSAPVFFLHLWLPSAHVEAPVAGSMILAGVLLSLGGYGLLRFIGIISCGISMVGGYMVGLSLVGGFMASLVCLCQVDLKSLIAYSSVGHMGLVLGGIISMTFVGWRGSLVLMVGHGLCSSGLFCLANLIYERMGSRSMAVVKGMMVVMPGFTLWFFLMCVSNMAAPPSLGLFGEIMLFGGLVSVWWWGIFVVMLMMFLSGVYSLWMYSYVVHGDGWFIGVFLGIEVREYLLILGHWIPLNVFGISLDFVSLWV